MLCMLLTPKQCICRVALDTIGSTAPHVNISTICNYLLPVPALTEQKEIADYLDAKCAEIDGLIAKKEQLVKELESYKKSLFMML